MLTRQIQKTGGSSYSIILPKEWITRNGVKGKDTLQLYELHNNDILISTNKGKVRNSATIRVDKLKPRIIMREILAYYVRGYNEINLTSRGSLLVDVRKTVKNANELMFGFEIFDEKPNLLVLKNVSTNNVPSSAYLRKEVSNIRGMYTDLVSAINFKNKSLADDIVFRDSDIDRINFLILRKSIREIKEWGTTMTVQTNLLESVFNQLVSIKLERIADHIVKMATLIRDNDSNEIEISDNVSKCLEEGSKYLELCENLIKYPDKKITRIIRDIHDDYKNLQVENEKGCKNMSCLDIKIKNSVERIQSYIANIAEDVINFSP